MDTIEYDFYENPGKSSEFQKSKYHVRICNRQTVDTDNIVKAISKQCTLTPADIHAVIVAFQDEIAFQLQQGKIVHLDGLCQFDISLKSRLDESSGKENGSDIVLKSVNINPDKKLTERVRKNLCHRVKSRGKHSDPISEIEIIGVLTEHFKKKSTITRAEFQNQCSITKYMACIHINRLLSEGKLKNIGYRRHPIYTAVPGNFGVSRE
ncbi:HU family DNA-binding protein [uncultured Bacteroides sp.]|uniref:HU family DNA-binding protein n=1 Tax=uncultured Bacteroides sp. TaxID=162156 RepID=UPI002631542A|nr:HU family DNA-binding protein [uncultured Bacteroides sp.]